MGSSDGKRRLHAVFIFTEKIKRGCRYGKETGSVLAETAGDVSVRDAVRIRRRIRENPGECKRKGTCDAQMPFRLGLLLRCEVKDFRNRSYY